LRSIDELKANREYGKDQGDDGNDGSRYGPKRNRPMPTGVLLQHKESHVNAGFKLIKN
jgi:hypothetical protein